MNEYNMKLSGKVNEAIETKNIEKLGIILKTIQELSDTDLFTEVPLDGYSDVEEKIGEKAAFTEISKYWSTRGLNFLINPKINTMVDFLASWDCTNKEIADQYFSLEAYQAQAEFILNHLEQYNNDLTNFSKNLNSLFEKERDKKIALKVIAEIESSKEARAFLNIARMAIRNKDIEILGIILKVVEEIAQEDIFVDGPLDGYWNVEEDIGETVAFTELSNYWTSRGVNLNIKPEVDTMGKFQDSWDTGDTEFWDKYSSLPTYQGYAEFILNHLDNYTGFYDFAKQLLDFIEGNVGEDFVQEALEKIEEQKGVKE